MSVYDNSFLLFYVCIYNIRFFDYFPALWRKRPIRVRCIVILPGTSWNPKSLPQKHERQASKGCRHVFFLRVDQGVLFHDETGPDALQTMNPLWRAAPYAEFTRGACAGAFGKGMGHQQ